MSYSSSATAFALGRDNRLEGIAKSCQGRLSAYMELDRQNFQFLFPGHFRDQIKGVVRQMKA